MPIGEAAVTGGAGKVTFTGLEPGRPMWLKETRAPAGYQPEQTPREILLPATAPYAGEITVENEVRVSGGGGGGGDAGGGAGGSHTGGTPAGDPPENGAPDTPPSEPNTGGNGQDPSQSEQPVTPAPQPSQPRPPQATETTNQTAQTGGAHTAAAPSGTAAQPKLPQTGQPWGAVWVLGALGMLLLTTGRITRRPYRGRHEK